MVSPVKLDLQDMPLQEAVWTAMLTIPPGEVKTYGSTRPMALPALTGSRSPCWAWP